MKIGIMGGTFDPIHKGHLMLGEAALHQCGLDEVWFMPNGNPPHKSKESIQSTVKDRLAMTELAVRDCEKFRVEPYEADRESISYTYETLEHFSKVYPKECFYFIIGADSLFAIDSWVHPEKIFPRCILLAAYRDDIDTPEEMYAQMRLLKRQYPDIQAELLHVSPMEVSSHEIRRRLREGLPVSEFLPEQVETYIREEGLYERRAQ